MACGRFPELVGAKRPALERIVAGGDVPVAERVERWIDDVAVSRAVHLSASRYCLVSAHLSAGDTTIHHRYRVSDATGTRTGDVLVTGPFGAGLEPVEPTRAAPI